MSISPSPMSEFSWLSESLGQQATIVEQATQLIRELIISGRLASGERIVESKIAREWRVGQPTVREALKSLESEGLVTYSPNRGCSVTELTGKQIEQITRLRTALEMLAIEIAVENRADWNPQVLRDAINDMKDAAQKGDANRYYQCDLRFHQKLWEVSANEYLTKALTSVVLPLFSFVLRKHYQEKQIDLVINAKEHEMLAEAVISSSPEQVKSDVEKILADFGNIYLELAKNNS
jgi:DNA-binding GntR family transcriptional regulator